MNRVTIVGNLGKAPELRHTTSGIAVASLRVATTSSFTGQDGQRQKTTEWHDIEVWKKPAEACAAHLTVGSKVGIEGRIQTDTWDDKATGQKRSRTKIVAHSIEFLGSGKKADVNQEATA